MIFNRLSTSFRDDISGLYSEAYFAEVFHREWHRMLRERDALSIIIIRPHLSLKSDNDKMAFKLISELVEKATKRATDLVCRFGENEIAIGAFNLDEDGTETIIHRVLTSSETTLAGLIYSLNLSIGGLNIFPSNQIDINSVFKLTEELTSKAESRGSNTYEIGYYQMH